MPKTKMIPLDIPVETYDRVEELGRGLGFTTPTKYGERVNISAVFRLLLTVARDFDRSFYLWVHDHYEPVTGGANKSMSFQVPGNLAEWMEYAAERLKMTTLKVRGVEKPNVAALVRAALEFPFGNPKPLIQWLVSGAASGVEPENQIINTQVSIAIIDKEKDSG